MNPIDLEIVSMKDFLIHDCPCRHLFEKMQMQMQMLCFLCRHADVSESCVVLLQIETFSNSYIFTPMFHNLFFLQVLYERLYFLVDYSQLWFVYLKFLCVAGIPQSIILRKIPKVQNVAKSKVYASSWTSNHGCWDCSVHVR